MTTTIVYGQDELWRTLHDSYGGETILLAPGEYGRIDVRGKKYSSPITIASLDPDQPAVVERMNLSASENITIDNISFARLDTYIPRWHFEHVRLDASKNITIRNSRFEGAIVNDGSDENGKMNGAGIFSTGVDNLVVENTTFETLHKPINVAGYRGGALSGNTILNYREDAIYIVAASDLVIEDNFVYNAFAPAQSHPDIIQITGIRDSVIRNNFLHQGYEGPSQGIFLGAGKTPDSYNGNVLIENNIVYSSMVNAIYAHQIPDVTVRNNTVLMNLSKYMHQPGINIVGDKSENAKIYNNISEAYHNINGAFFERNGVFQNNIDVQGFHHDKPDFYNTVVLNGSRNGAATLRDFIIRDEVLDTRGHVGAGVDGFHFMPGYADILDPGPIAWRSLAKDAPLRPFLPDVQHFGAGDVLGTAVTLSGNTWKLLRQDFDVAAGDVLSFTATIAGPAEIYGIGLVRDGAVDPAAIFQIGGSQAYGLAPTSAVAAIDGATRVSVDLSAFAGQSFDGLALIADDDAASAADITFSDIALTKATTPWRTLDVTPETLQSYEPELQDVAGGAFVVTEAANAVELHGNTWKMIPGPFHVSEDTRLRLDAKSLMPGEIYGVRLIRDGEAGPELTFQIGGVQNYGVQDYRIDDAALAAGATVMIDIGRHARGRFEGIALIADDDASASASVRYANVQITAQDQGDMLFDPQALGVEPFLQGIQNFGTATVGTGDGVELRNNAWMTLATPIDVDIDTTLSFTFEAFDEAEIYAVGLYRDADQGDLPRLPFQLAGSQIWGEQAFRVDDDGPIGPKTVTIDLGHYYQGRYDGVLFVVDDDAGGRGHARFSDLRIGDPDPALKDPDAPPPPTTRAVRFDDGLTSHMPGVRDFGQAEVLDWGDTLILTDNAWVRDAVGATATETSRLSFLFRTPAVGEISAVAVESEGELLIEEATFRLAGDQVWGDDAYMVADPSSWTRVDIDLSGLAGRRVDALIFAADDDAQARGESWFRDMALHDMLWDAPV